ncbi:MAG: tetratricopeptide repeat protein [Bacteroidetes bacterium]|nr:tetratricopeptide repeat protein [Bacteroidota bacterium]
MSRIPLLEQFLADDPSDAFTRFALAQEYAKSGDLDAALGHYEALRREQPDYVGTYYHLGALLRQAGRLDDALVVYREGIAAATAAGDAHARSELQGVLLNAELGDD